jgi:hypothetical protein
MPGERGSLVGGQLRRFAHHAEDGNAVDSVAEIELDQPVGAGIVDFPAFVERGRRNDENPGGVAVDQAAHQAGHPGAPSG